MDSRARIPVESAEEFDEWFWNARPLERPGESQRQRPTALQAVAPADSSPGHSIDLDEITRVGDGDPSDARKPETCIPKPRAVNRGSNVLKPSSGASGRDGGERPTLPTSEDDLPAPPLIAFVSWYRHKAEELGDCAAEMISEGIEGIAYGAARRAAHFGAIANRLYKERAEELKAQHPAWFRPGHGNFL